MVTAKIFALSAYRLLRDRAVKAKEIVANYQPIFTKEEYIKYMDSFIGTILVLVLLFVDKVGISATEEEISAAVTGFSSNINFQDDSCS